MSNIISIILYLHAASCSCILCSSMIRSHFSNTYSSYTAVLLQLNCGLEKKKSWSCY